MEATRKEHARGLLFSHSFLSRSFPFFSFFSHTFASSSSPSPSPSPPSSSSTITYTKTHRGRPVHWLFSLSRLFFPACHPLFLLFLFAWYVRAYVLYVRTAIGRQTPVSRMQFACHPSRLDTWLMDSIFLVLARLPRNIP